MKPLAQRLPVRDARDKGRGLIGRDHVRAPCLFVVLSLWAAVPRAAEPGAWIDLTHPFDATTIYWPTENGFQFDAGANGPTAKGYYYAANRFSTAEHGGTHLDAPRHFSATGLTSDAIPVERLVGRRRGGRVGEVCRRPGLRGVAR